MIPIPHHGTGRVHAPLWIVIVRRTVVQRITLSGSCISIKSERRRCMWTQLPASRTGMYSHSRA